jgi:hypothetical protein
MTYLRTVRQLGSVIHLVFEIKFQRIHKPSYSRGFCSAVRIFNFLSHCCDDTNGPVEITSVTEKLKLEFSFYILLTVHRVMILGK